MKGYFESKLTKALTLTVGEEYNISYEYDGSSRIVKETVSGSVDREINYSYDANDNIVTETIKIDGKTITKTYAYDDLNNITGVVVKIL